MESLSSNLEWRDCFAFSLCLCSEWMESHTKQQFGLFLQIVGAKSKRPKNFVNNDSEGIKCHSVNPTSEFDYSPISFEEDLTKHIRAEDKGKQSVLRSGTFSLRAPHVPARVWIFPPTDHSRPKKQGTRAQRPKRTSVGRRRTAEHCLSCLFVFEVLTCDK